METEVTGTGGHTAPHPHTWICASSMPGLTRDWKQRHHVSLLPKALPVSLIQLHTKLMWPCCGQLCRRPATQAHARALPMKDTEQCPVGPGQNPWPVTLVESSVCHWHMVPPVPSKTWQHAQSRIRSSGARNPRAVNHIDVRNVLIRALSDQLGLTGPIAAA